MSSYRVVFRQEALEDLEELYDFIADARSPENAASFTESIVSFCESFADFPQRGTQQRDLDTVDSAVATSLACLTS